MDIHSMEARSMIDGWLCAKYPYPRISEGTLSANDNRKQEVFATVLNSVKDTLRDELARAGVMFDGAEDLSSEAVNIQIDFISNTTGELLNNKVVAFTRKLFDRKVEAIENKRMAAFDFVMAFFPNGATAEELMSFIKRLPD